MRILLVASKYLPNVGGLEKAVFCLNREFVRLGHDTLIVTNRYSRSLLQREQIDGTEVRRYYFTLGLPKPNPVQIAKYPFRVAAAIPAISGLRRAIAQFRPDVVNLHFAGPAMLYCLLALKGSSVPFVLSLHGADVETDIVQSPMRRWLFRQCATRAARVTSNSAYLMGRAAEFCPSLSDKAAVVGNGVEAAMFGASIGGRLESFQVATVGRLVRTKGVDVLVEAMADVRKTVPQARLSIAGDGPEMSRLQSQADSLGLSAAIEFKGMVSPEEISSMLNTSAVFCLPSRQEAFGIAVAEAMAHGLPIVASKTGGVPEVLRHGELGVLVEPENPQALAHAICRCLMGPPLVASAKLIQTAQEEFSWRSVATRYLSAFEGAIERTEVT